MSLASPYQEQYYVADGVTTSFAFGQGFTALNEIDIKCIIYFEDGTDCIPVFNVNTTTGYINIVTLTKPDGTVLTVPPAGSIVRVFRDTPEQQNVTASQLQNYTAKQLERIFDSIVAMIQEVSYSDQHKTIRLTETQRDIAIDYLPNDKDQAVIYWDIESRKLMPADFGQNQVVKSDGIEWLVYNKSEGKIYYVPREGGNPIPIGKATIHNDLSGRNAPDCHPESAITGLTQDLQELRDKDLALEEDVQTALNRSQEAKDTADEAKDIAEYAQSQVAEAKEMAIDAKEAAESVVGIAQEALDKVTQEITDREDADSALQDQITINKGTMDNHIANTNNPHQVTKTQVGLGNVDNTSDLDKPISTATQAALDGKMSASVKYGATIVVSLDNTNYKMTTTLKDQDGNTLGSAQVVDLPLESVVVSGSYDSATKEVILTLQDGSTIRFSVADLVSGLQTEITAQNPLNADFVNDSTSVHKFVTATEKTNWNNHIANTNNPHSVTKAQVGLGNVDNTADLDKPISTATQTALNGKQATISDLATIRSNAQAGKAASDTIATYGNIVTHNVSEFATATQGTKADTAVQPGDLATVATTGDYDDLLNKPTIPAAQVNSDWNAVSGVAQILNKPTLGTMASESASDYVEVAGDTMTGSLTLYTNPGSGLATNLTFLDKYNNEIDLFQDGETLKVHLHTANKTISFPTTSGTLALTSDIPVTDVTVGGTSVVSSGVAAVPAIPTVNNPTITITQGGVTKGSFTLNQATGDTIDLDAGGGSGSGYHPDLFDVKWADHICNDVQWLRADTYSWQSGAVYQVAYQHLADDIDGKTLQSETISGTTIQFYLADDGHKICPASEESNVASIYSATGVAWYYIIDTTNQRFKLPRINPDKELLNISAPVITAANQMNTNGMPTLKFKTTSNGNPGGGGVAVDGSNNFIRTNQSLGTNRGNLVPSNLIADLSNATGVYRGKQYLYFYVGNFTQTALENTAGITTEEMNNKVNIGHEVIEFQAPTSANNYTWYRKYADGWVEQGGRTTTSNQTITFPIAFADIPNMTWGLCTTRNNAASYDREIFFGSITATNFISGSRLNEAVSPGYMWHAVGMAAN